MEELQHLQTCSFAELLPILQELERRDLIQKIPNHHYVQSLSTIAWWLRQCR